MLQVQCCTFLNLPGTHDSFSAASVNDKIWTHWGQPDSAALYPPQNESERRSPLGVSKAFLLYLGGLVFFGMPRSYVRRIEYVHRAEGVNTMRWQAFLATLISEWRDTSLLVRRLSRFARLGFDASHRERFLSRTSLRCVVDYLDVADPSIRATVSLLAAPDISEVSWTLSIVSTMSAISCVLVGMFFLWFHQPHARSSGDVGVSFIQVNITLADIPIAVLLREGDGPQ